MWSRCPRPDCQYQFEAPAGSQIVNCPQCKKEARFRSLDLLGQIDRIYERRLQSQAVAGGPAGWPLQTACLSALVEDVRSLWNVGSIFRTADGAGIGQLFLCGITGCPPRAEINKTSLGAEESVSWRYYRNSLEVLPQLAEQGVQIVGLELGRGSVALGQALAEGKIRTPLCLVVGNEVCGLAAETASCCELLCYLPMRGVKESLNVAVAFGAAAYLVTEHLPTG